MLPQVAPMISTSKGYLTIWVRPKPFICDCSQLGQFLFNDDKSLIKLNDFNRAEFLLYDEKGQKYCKYGEGQGAGNVSLFQGIQHYWFSEQFILSGISNMEILTPCSFPFRISLFHLSYKVAISGRILWPWSYRASRCVFPWQQYVCFTDWIVPLLR